MNRLILLIIILTSIILTSCTLFLPEGTISDFGDVDLNEYVNQEITINGRAVGWYNSELYWQKYVLMDSNGYKINIKTDKGRSLEEGKKYTLTGVVRVERSIFGTQYYLEETK